jgi:hypothetical protein
MAPRSPTESTTWRISGRAEQARDRRALEGFLQPAVAAAIAAMPCVVMDPEAAAPLSLRIDAWLWRSSQLLRQPGSPVTRDIEWIDNLPAIRKMVEQRAREAA